MAERRIAPRPLLDSAPPHALRDDAGGPIWPPYGYYFGRPDTSNVVPMRPAGPELACRLEVHNPNCFAPPLMLPQGLYQHQSGVRCHLPQLSYYDSRGTAPVGFFGGSGGPLQSLLRDFSAPGTQQHVLGTNPVLSSELLCQRLLEEQPMSS